MSDWARIREYGARFEADIHASMLESAGIPVLVKGSETGIFGPGFAGATALGVELLVPADLLEEAREVIADADGAEGGS